MLRGIYSAIYGEVNVSVCVEIKGDYIEKQQSCFISVTLKSWSGRKLLEPLLYILYRNTRTAVAIKENGLEVNAEKTNYTVMSPDHNSG